MAGDARDLQREPYTEEELAAIWVDGGPPKLTRPIVVVDYDDEWPSLFRREAARVAGLLGGRALRIEHVGSTAVPGLPAKPIIDIDLVVADSADEAAYLPVLQSAGYRLVIRERAWYEHRCLTGPDTNVNLHVYSAGCPEVERTVAFRDRLRADEADRELYARTKRELAGRQWTYVQQYADAKTAVITVILGRSAADRP
jgi:GrpB-like predicted nucleotidyltransferase (UPF0157 family)